MSRCVCMGYGVAATLASVLAANLSVAGEPSAAKAARAERAAKLVDEAQRAEMEGDTERKAGLLQEALKIDEDFERARWELGEVKFAGHWRPLSAIHDLVAADPRWDEYAALRDEADDTVEAHEALAGWCMKQGLEAEERYHWRQVLRSDRSHEHARSRLNVVEYRGQFYYPEQVAKLKEEAKQAEEAYDRYRPEFLALCRMAKNKNEVIRKPALAKLRAVDDIQAVEALEAAVKIESRGKGPTLDLKLAVIAALSNMKPAQATLRLLDYAVYAELPEVRTGAIEALKLRRKTDYVPRLMAELSAPIEAEIGVQVAPDGTVSLSENLKQAGPQADRVMIRSKDYVTEALANQFGERFSIWPTVNRTYERALSTARTRQERIDVANEWIAERNVAIEAVLAGASGLTLPEDIGDLSRAEAWWMAWFNYNELYSDGHPVYETTYYDADHQYIHAPYAGPVSGGEVVPAVPAGCCCFAAGTLVWTTSGPAPIESIQEGDMVLSQHPVTGELGYRAVLDKTRRPPSPTVRLEFASDSLMATPGHRFWVNGRGWEMAKFLRPDASLGGLDGPVSLAAVRDEEHVESYNLSVDEFHTYFVGKAQLLVHDNVCPRPVVGPAPGMKAPQVPAPLPKTLAAVGPQAEAE